MSVQRFDFSVKMTFFRTLEACMSRRSGFKRSVFLTSILEIICGLLFFGRFLVDFSKC